MRREAGSLPGSLSSLSEPSSLTEHCQDLCLQRSLSHALDHSEHNSVCLPPATASVPFGYLLKSVEYGCRETILIYLSALLLLVFYLFTCPYLQLTFSFCLTHKNAFSNHIYFQDQNVLFQLWPVLPPFIFGQMVYMTLLSLLCLSLFPKTTFSMSSISASHAYYWVFIDWGNSPLALLKAQCWCK